MKAEEEYKEFVDGNVELLVKRVEQHPDTMFYFFYPPYSMLWWDNMYRSGGTGAGYVCGRDFCRKAAGL